MKIKHGQLFGGVFGFGLAAQWAGIENVWYNDNDHYCCEVIRARMRDGQIKDNVKIYEQDIRNIGKHNLQSVDIISAGTPCQPASIAGKRKGKADDRWLWEETLRVCGEIKPTFILFENVPGLLTLENGKAFEGILTSLEAEGYTTESYLIPACSIGAWHRRDRIWIVSYSKGIGREWRDSVFAEVQGTSGERITTPFERSGEAFIANTNSTQRGSNKRKSNPETNGGHNIRGICQDVPNSKSTKCKYSINTWKGRDGFANLRENVTNTDNAGLQTGRKRKKSSKEGFITGINATSGKFRQIKSNLGGMANGLPPELVGYWDREPENVPRIATGVKNRVNRLKGLGNAVCPQIPYIFFTIINKILNNEN